MPLNNFCGGLRTCIELYLSYDWEPCAATHLTQMGAAFKENEDATNSSQMSTGQSRYTHNRYTKVFPGQIDILFPRLLYSNTRAKIHYLEIHYRTLSQH